MADSVQNINVEEIMEEIRRDIKEKGYTNDDVSFADVSADEKYATPEHSFLLAHNVKALQINYNVNAYRPLVSTRPLGGLIVFIRKVIRKLIKFYIEPIVFDQNDVNRLTVTCLKDFYLDMEAMEKRIVQLEETIKKLENKGQEQ